MIEIFLGESRFEFFTTIMVMNATGKPDALQVDFECLEFLAFSVAFIVQINGFQCFSDAKVVLSLLVERDISSHQGSLSQAENIQFLVER